MDRNIDVHLRAHAGSYVAAMGQAAAATTGLQTSISGVGPAGTRSFGGLSRAGAVAVGGVTALAAGFGYAIRSAIDFESAFAGVAKTVDASDATLATLREGILEMSQTLPATATEIAAVAEAAGQLGIATPNILEFSRVMIDLGETTNLTADEAATSLAQLANITGMAQGDFDRLGSAIVDLGNKGASTEAQITELAQRLAGAGTTVGMSEQDIVGFGAAIANVGIEAEMGGSAFSRAMLDIDSAVASSSDKLDIFAETAGMSAEQFSAAWREDPAAAMTAFLDGLGAVEAAGGNTTAILDSLGLGGIRVGDTLRRLSLDAEGVAESLGIADEAWAQNTALTDEAAKRYETTAAKLEIVRNKIVGFFIDLGTASLGPVAAAADLVAAAFDRIGDAASFLADTFGPTFANLVDIVGELGSSVQPVVGALLSLGGGAVTAGLAVLGGALAEVTGFLADHGEIVMAVAGAYTAHLIPAAMTWAFTSGAWRTAWAGAQRLKTVMMELATIAVHLRAADFSSAFAGLAGVINPATLAIVGLGAAIGWLVYDTARTNAEFDELVTKASAIDEPTSIRAWQDSLEGLRAKVAETKEAIRDFEGSWGSQEGMRLARDAKVATAALDEAESTIRDFEDAAWSAAEAALGFGEKTGVTRSEVLELYSAIVSGSDELDIDWSKVSPEEMLPKLRELGEEMLATEQVTSGTGVAQEAFATAMMGAGDAAGEAASALDAYRSAVDLLYGSTLKTLDNEIAFQAGLDNLTQSLIDNKATFDINTEAGRANLGVLADLNQSILDIGEDVFANTESWDAATEAMSSHAQQMQDTLRAAGATEEQIAFLNATINLTPERVKILFAEENADYVIARLQEGVSIAQILDEIEAGVVVSEEGTDAAIDQMKALGAWLSFIDRQHPTAEVDADTAAAQTALGALLVSTFPLYESSDPTAEAHVDITAAQTALGALLVSTFPLYESSDPTATAYLSTGPAADSFWGLMGMGREWSGSDPTAEAFLGLADPAAGFNALWGMGRSYAGSNPTTHAGLDIKPAMDSLAYVKQHLDNWAASPTIKRVEVVASGLGALAGAGGLFLPMADGGITAPRGLGRGVPQMWDAGYGTIIWDEPQTQGESYIPWGADRRAGALSILAATAGLFGYQLTAAHQKATAMAYGGMVAPPGITPPSEIARLGGGDVVFAPTINVRVDTRVGADPHALTAEITRAVSAQLDAHDARLRSAMDRRRR